MMSPKGQVGSRLRHQSHGAEHHCSTTPCLLQPSGVLSSVFPSVSLLSSHPLPAQKAILSPAASLPVLCFSAFLATPTASLDGWLPPKPQPHCMAPRTCFCQRREAACAPPLPPVATTSRPRTGYLTPLQPLSPKQSSHSKRDKWDGKWLFPGITEPRWGRGCSNMVTESFWPWSLPLSHLGQALIRP